MNSTTPRFRELPKKRRPRHVIKYRSTDGGATYRNVSRDYEGNPLITVIAGTTAELRFDYRAILAIGEYIEDVVLTASAILAQPEQYNTYIDVKFITPGSGEMLGAISLSVRTNHAVEIPSICFVKPRVPLCESRLLPSGRLQRAKPA